MSDLWAHLNPVRRETEWKERGFESGFFEEEGVVLGGLFFNEKNSLRTEWKIKLQRKRPYGLYRISRIQVKVQIYPSFLGRKPFSG